MCARPCLIGVSHKPKQNRSLLVVAQGLSDRSVLIQILFIKFPIVRSQDLRMQAYKRHVLFPKLKLNKETSKIHELEINVFCFIISCSCQLLNGF